MAEFSLGLVGGLGVIGMAVGWPLMQAIFRECIGRCVGQRSIGRHSENGGVRKPGSVMEPLHSRTIRML